MNIHFNKNIVALVLGSLLAFQSNMSFAKDTQEQQRNTQDLNSQILTFQNEFSFDLNQSIDSLSEIQKMVDLKPKITRRIKPIEVITTTSINSNKQNSSVKNLKSNKQKTEESNTEENIYILEEISNMNKELNNSLSQPSKNSKVEVIKYVNDVNEDLNQNRNIEIYQNTNNSNSINYERNFDSISKNQLFSRSMLKSPINAYLSYVGDLNFSIPEDIILQYKKQLLPDFMKFDNPNLYTYMEDYETKFYQKIDKSFKESIEKARKKEERAIINIKFNNFKKDLDNYIKSLSPY